MNNVYEVQPLNGYWLHLTGPATLSLPGATLDPGLALTLFPGWNLVGFAGAQPEPLATALGDLAGSVDVVFGFDATRGGIMSAFTDPTKAVLNNLTTMQPDQGYWIHLTGAASRSWSGQ